MQIDWKHLATHDTKDTPHIDFKQVLGIHPGVKLYPSFCLGPRVLAGVVENQPLTGNPWQSHPNQKCS